MWTVVAFSSPPISRRSKLSPGLAPLSAKLERTVRGQRNSKKCHLIGVWWKRKGRNIPSSLFLFPIIPVLCQWNLDSGLPRQWDSGFPWAEFWISKPTVPDSTSKKFPIFRNLDSFACVISCKPLQYLWVAWAQVSGGLKEFKALIIGPQHLILFSFPMPFYLRTLIHQFQRDVCLRFIF